MRAPEHRVDRGRLSRSVFAMLGMRPPSAQHSRLEGELLRRYARGCRTVVEIGVAEGGSAWEMRQVIAADGAIYLIDAYHLGHLGPLSPARLVAHRLVGSVGRGTATWIENFSHIAAVDWSTPIDFLFIDGDHSVDGVVRDWNLWTPHVRSGGHVALHDARREAPWTGPDWGPVLLLDRLTASSEWELVDGVDSLAVLARRP